MAYVKPHGALYNTVVHHEGHARAVVAAVRDLPVRGAAGVGRAGRGDARAGCARSPRPSPTAATARTGRWCRARSRVRWSRTPTRSPPGWCGSPTEGVVAAVDGTEVRVDAESVCVHSDTPGAAALARSVRAALVEHGVAVPPFVA